MAQDRFVVRSEEAEEGATRFSQPWNPRSELYGTRLSSLVGFFRVGVSRVRVPRPVRSRSPTTLIVGRSGSMYSRGAASRR